MSVLYDVCEARVRSSVRRIEGVDEPLLLDAFDFSTRSPVAMLHLLREADVRRRRLEPRGAVRCRTRQPTTASSRLSAGAAE